MTVSVAGSMKLIVASKDGIARPPFVRSELAALVYQSETAKQPLELLNAITSLASYLYDATI